MSHIRAQGAREVTHSDLENILENIRTIIENSNQRNAAALHPPLSDTTSLTNIEQSDYSWWKLFEHPQGKFSYIPVGFEFPRRLSLNEMWNLFFFGDRESKIRPYRFLAKFLTRKDQIVFSQSKKVIEYLVCLGNEHTNNVSDIRDSYKMTHIQLNSFYDCAYRTLCIKLGDGVNMRADLSYRTIYNRILSLSKEGDIEES